MKIVRYFLTAILGLVIGVFAFSMLTINEVKATNKKLNNEIKETDVESVKEKNIAYEKELEELKESKKEQCEELDIWETMLEKLKKASM